MQNMLSYTLLSGRGMIAVSGVEAQTFLQGLVSVDVMKLKPGYLRYGMLLSPQGKFLHDFFLRAEGERIFIDAEAARLHDLLGRLRMYRLRAQVELAELPDMKVFALWGDAPAPVSAWADPRQAGLGWRYYAATPPQGAKQPFDVYDRLRLSLGVPDGSRDMIPERSLPMECGLEALGGADFDKGCYVGQEVTARSKFRAQLRKRLYVVRAEAMLPPPGTPVMQGGQQAGDMRSSCGGIGLALLNQETVEQARARLQADGMEIAVFLPPWAAAETAGEGAGKGV